jgi:hypothetical protein
MYSFRSSNIHQNTFNPMGFFNSMGVYVSSFYNQYMNRPGQIAGAKAKDAYFQAPRAPLRELPTEYALGLGGKGLFARQRGTSYSTILPATPKRPPGVVFFRGRNFYVGDDTYIRAYHVPEPVQRAFIVPNEHLVK